MTTQPNPYAAPQARVEDVSAASSDSAAIRQEHIKHEASIRSVAILYFLSGLAAGLGGLGVVASFFVSGEESGGLIMVLGVVYLGLSALSFAIWHGLRALRPWARITAIVLGFIGLLGFPLGTLINGYILYLLLSQKGKRIFEPDYRNIIAATPTIKYRTSVIAWIVLGVLIAAIAAIVFAVALGGD
jgi:hypothetical protein